MNDSWPEIIRDGKSRNKSRSRQARLEFHCDTVRGSRYCFSAALVFPYFSFLRREIVAKRFPQELFPTARLSVDYSQSLKIADSFAVNREIRKKEVGKSRAILV